MTAYKSTIRNTTSRPVLVGAAIEREAQLNRTLHSVSLFAGAGGSSMGYQLAREAKGRRRRVRLERSELELLDASPPCHQFSRAGKRRNENM